jgi:hypothetical protein
MSVCPSAWNKSAPTGRIFVKSYISVFFGKICRENWFLIKIWQEQHEDRQPFWSYLSHFFSEQQIFQTQALEKIKMYVLYSITFLFRKSCPFTRLMWKL